MNQKTAKLINKIVKNNGTAPKDIKKVKRQMRKNWNATPRNQRHILREGMEALNN